MKIIDLPIKDIDLSLFMKATAKESDCSILIDYDCLITSGGKPKILYLKLTEDTSEVRQACKNIKYSKVERLSRGLVTGGFNRTFGLRPKRGISQFANMCSATSLAKESQIEHDILCEFVKKITPLYEKYFPEEWKINNNQLEKKVLREWKIEGTPFTSGIVNKNSQLQYHFDIGHFEQAMSIMLTLKGGCKGGGLCFPELDIRLELADNTVLIMDGQELLHGVTSIIPNKLNHYRNTIVWYSLKQMWKCLPIDEEIIATRKMRANKEADRAKGVIKKMTLDTIKSGGTFSPKLMKSLSKKKAK